MTVLISNFSYSTLAFGVTNSQTTLTVQTGHGARFPQPSGTGADYFYLVLEDSSLNREIVKCTARATDVLTIVRGQDNTTGTAFLASASVALRLNAAAINDANLRTSATGSIAVSAGTTAQRDGSPLVGYFRYNTTTGGFEGYTGAGWSVFSGGSPRATRVDVASVAGTVDLTAVGPATSDDIRITGALVITGFTVTTDRVLRVTAGGAFTLKSGASLVTQFGVDIVCATGDTFMLRATAANVVEVLCYVPVTARTASIPPASLTQPLTLGAPVGLTNQTSVQFSIPTWAKRIKVILDGAVTAASAIAQIQIGSGSLQTTGYVCNIANINAGAGQGSLTSGHGLIYTPVNGVHTGVVEFVSRGSNVWVATSVVSYGTSGQMAMSTTTVTLSGTLDRIALTTTSGSVQFNAGAINVMWD